MVPRLAVCKQVGQRMRVVIKVDRDASSFTVNDKAVEQLKLLDSALHGKKYRLLYPDLKEEVLFLPGSVEEAFTPRKYVSLLGTYYSKVRLYLISEEDYVGKASFFYFNIDILSFSVQLFLPLIPQKLL